MANLESRTLHGDLGHSGAQFPIRGSDREAGQRHAQYGGGSRHRPPGDAGGDERRSEHRGGAGLAIKEGFHAAAQHRSRRSAGSSLLLRVAKESEVLTGPEVEELRAEADE